MDLRRTFDIGASLGSLALLSPVFLATATINALYFKDKPYFTDERVGKDGETFKILKWRSMHDKIDETGKKLPDNERITSYGKFLRGTAIDETLQLVNILKGEMSFFGPRPHSPQEVEAWRSKPDGEKYDEILSVRPGLTGAWQVSAIGDTTGGSSANRLDIELASVQAANTLNDDIKLILKSIPALYKGHNGETPSDAFEKPRQKITP